MNFEAAGISILLCRFGVFRLLSFCWDLQGEAGRRKNSEGGKCEGVRDLREQHICCESFCEIR